MKRFELTDLAADALAQLEAEGIRPTPQDVLRVQALSLKASGAGSLLKGTPRSVGGHTFWPLTIGASCWFGDFIRFTDEEGAEYRDLLWFAFAYASEHARQPERLSAYGKDAVREIRRWKRRLAITEAELRDAVEGAIGETATGETPDGDLCGEDFDREDMAVMLSATVGGDYGAWLWTCNLDSAAAIVRRAVAANIAASGGKGGSRETVEGLRALADYVAEIRAREAKPGSAEAGGEAAEDGAEG